MELTADLDRIEAILEHLLRHTHRRHQGLVPEEYIIEEGIVFMVMSVGKPKGGTVEVELVFAGRGVMGILKMFVKVL